MNVQTSKLKKVTGIILILVMLLLPFTSLLNVKAADVTIAVDDTKLLESDKNFKRATNKTNIILNDVGEYNEDATQMDTFSAYKILDVYYNETTNEIVYDFTTDFSNFKKSLDSNDEIYKLDVSGYLELTGGYSFSEDTNLTLNKLVSKYTTYIRKQTSGTVSSIQFGQGTESTQRIASNVEVGSYLILPDNIVNGKEESFTNIFDMIGSTYTVLVGNAVFNIVNGNWTLEDCSVNAKKDYEVFQNMLIASREPDALFNLDENSGNYGKDMVYTTKNGMQLYSAYEKRKIASAGNEFPSNTHESIKNNAEISKLLTGVKFIFSSGLDIENIYFINSDRQAQKLSIRDNAAYFTSTEDNTEQKFADAVENDKELDDNGNVIGKSITFSGLGGGTMFVFEIAPNANANVGTNSTDPDNSGNKIITSTRYLKDPYVDIGTNPTDADINKALGTLSSTNIVYTYGINITNQDNSSNALSGAEFQLYSDKECTNPVGDKIVIGTDGTSLFKGIDDTNTYYLKQIKAATGYRLSTEVIEVSKEKLSLTDGLYNITITSAKMGLLPSTGGLGTIFYTLIGLLVVGAGAYEVVKYSKKQINS